MASLQNRAFAVMPERLRWHLLGIQHSLHEPEVRITAEVLRHGGTAMDVGGWWGPWTWRMARHADRVIVVEPVQELAAYLDRVSPDSVEVINAAASAESGRSVLWVPTGGVGSEGRSSLSVPVPDSEPVEVDLIRLDDLDLPELDLLKVDVEGHELDAIRGASEVLRRCRPTLVIELEQRFHEQPLAEVFEEIEALGYRGAFRDGRQWRPTKEFDVERWQTAWEDDVAAAGYFGSARFRSRYRNNFVFRPRR
jgi:FkbM family methyltransferase